MTNKKREEPWLNFRQVHFAYQDHPVLKGLSFKLGQGATLGIAGASGSGKSTLLRLLAGNLDAQKGQVLFKGDDLSDLRNPMVGGHPDIALVDQDHDLLPMLTLDENIERQLRHRSNSAAQRFLGQAHRALGLNRVKGQKAQALSAGQKQRASIAQALAKAPELLLLDEPFSNLDYPLKAEAMAYINQHFHAVTKVLVTHEPSDLLAWSDQILVLRQGRKVQWASAFQVYHFPENAYAGRLTGPLNVLKEAEWQQLALSEEASLTRPEHWVLAEKGEPSVTVEVVGRRLIGYATYLVFRFRDIDGSFLALWPHGDLPEKGTVLPLNIKKPLLKAEAF